MSSCGWRNYAANGDLKGPTPSDSGWHNYTAAGILKASVSGGTVTSVGLIATPISVFTVTGSPVTGASDITLDLDDQSANTVLAGPASGAPAEPAFRALVSDDIPNLDAGKITTGTLPVERGGTENATLTAEAILIGDGVNPVKFLSPGSSGNVARSNGTVWQSTQLDHGDLADLTASDDHTQYAVVAPGTDARNTIQPTLATVVPLTLKGAAAQSDNLQEWQNDSGTVLALVTATGGANFDGSVGVGTASNDASAKHQVDSTTQGSLIPRMTTAQRVAIGSPADGLEVYDTDIDKPFSYQNGVWKQHAAPPVNLLPNSSFEVWENSINTPPDNWTSNGSGITIDQESTIVKHGTYSAKVTRSGTDCHMSSNVYTVLGKTYCRDRIFTFGAWVYATVASRVRLRVNDGTTTTNSSYHSGGSAWEFLQCTFTVASGATALNVGLAVDTGNTSGYIDAATLVEGTGTDNFAPAVMPFNRFPTRATMWHDEATVVTGNAIAYAVQTAQIYNGVAVQTTAAQNDSFTHSRWIEAGTYTFYALGSTFSNRGIVTWYLDAVSLGTQDWYSAGLVQNVVKTIASIAITASGYHVVNGVIATKNASSSGYNMGLTKYWFAQASD